VQRLDDIVTERTPERLLRRNLSYWRSWVNKDDIPFGDLEPDLVRFYKQSLLILRTQIDNRGAILAANDSDSLDFNRDTYSYLWPRDGALVAHALDLAGQPDVARAFYAFCAGLMQPEGYLLHKYHPDGSVGSSWHPWAGPDGERQLPIQEDETALVVWALHEHYERYRDLEFVRPLYAPLIRRAGDFLVAYRDAVTNLPGASYDLWEERRGIHAFTVAAVWAGLRGAAAFAEIFGDGPRSDAYAAAAREIRDAAEVHLYDPARERFLRRINTEHGAVEADPVLDASLFGLFRFGMFDADDPRIVGTMRAVEERLWVRTDVGGIARYEDDYYYQVTGDLHAVPGNPWFICTLWLAEWAIARARSFSDLRRPLSLLRWVADAALPSGVLAEQLHPYHHTPLSVSPLTWSHATVVMVVKEYLAKLEEIARLEAKDALLSGRYDDAAVYD
jgi:GH15 family glucan-1,4-alpha-glucosidase